jgi:hypothetical protein
MNPDRPMADSLRQTIEADGDKIAFLSGGWVRATSGQ